MRTMGFLPLCAFIIPGAFAQSTCGNVQLQLTPDYSFAIGSSAGGGSYSFTLNGQALASGSITQLALFHFDNSLNSTSGIAPAQSSGTSFVPGKFGSGAAIATGGILSYPAAGNISFGDGAIELWIALTKSGADPIYSQYDHTLFRYTDANGNQLVFSESAEGGNFYAGTIIGKTFSGVGGIQTSSLNTGVWHHVAFTYSKANARLRLYLDGLLIQENDIAFSLPASNGASFTIDSDPYGHASAFLVDELRISSNEETAAQIQYDAARSTPFANDEVLLPLAGVSPGQLSYSVNGCGTASYSWTGIPITNLNPPSNLLPPGATSFALSFNTLQPAACAYSVGSLLPFASMQPFAGGQNTTSHQGTISGVSSNPQITNSVYIRCESNPDFVQTLQYRAVASPVGPFPRVGSIWWGSYLASTAPTQLGKIQLFLCPAFSTQTAQSVRAANPNVIILPNVNANETTSPTTPPNVPEAYYLHDVNGNRISDWPTPGTYLLNLTNPAVADFMADYAYQVLLQAGLVYDGIFFDNFHTTISQPYHDYNGVPHEIDAYGTGQPTDSTILNAAWSAGVYRLIASFRKLVPYGLATGHLDSRPPQAAALAVFNGESLNGDAPKVREGLESFGTLWQTLGEWFNQGQVPGITMVQSSPPLQVAYGYGYMATAAAPPEVQTFAQSFYPNMRFGLTTALMTDAFSTYDFGDTSSLVNWWYDEYNFSLGYPTGPAASLAPAGTSSNLLTNPNFDNGLSGWSLLVNTDAVASAATDTTIAATGNSSAHITVSQPSAINWHVSFEQGSVALTAGVTYQLQFWARSDAPRVITVNSQGGPPAYTWYDLNAQFSIGPSWGFYTSTFTPPTTVTDARIQFWVGDVASAVWVDGVSLSTAPPSLYRRDFTDGVVLLNGTASAQTIALEVGLQRFSGTQAPKFQYIVDDSDPAFTPTGAWNAVTMDSGFANGLVTGPGSQVANGPYYHAWKTGVHQLDASGGSATWNLQIPEDGSCTIQVWLPAGPNAASWTKNAIYEVVSGGNVVASMTVDQTTAASGDGWHMVATVNLTASGSPILRVHNGSSGSLIADAVYVTSTALYNDGSPAPQVTLAPFDGILLQRQTRVPALASRVNSVVNAASYQPAIASGGFVSIIGTGFGNSTRSWTSSDFSGNNLPTSLDGISVTINGKPAYVEYISPTQVNAITPDDDTIGQVQAQVTTPQGPSYSGTVLKQKMSPAFFTYQSGTTTYVAALHLDGTLVGPAGPSSRPAVPGEVLEIYGTGFGPTNPTAPTSQLVSQPAPLSLPATVAIGGVNAQVQWAGIVSSGLYQLNVQIPNVAAGDQPVQASVSGFQSVANAFLAVAPQ